MKATKTSNLKSGRGGDPGTEVKGAGGEVKVIEDETITITTVDAGGVIIFRRLGYRIYPESEPVSLWQVEYFLRTDFSPVAIAWVSCHSVTGPTRAEGTNELLDVYVLPHLRHRGLAARLAAICQERWPGIDPHEPLTPAGNHDGDQITPRDVYSQGEVDQLLAEGWTQQDIQRHITADTEAEESRDYAASAQLYSQLAGAAAKRVAQLK